MDGATPEPTKPGVSARQGRPPRARAAARPPVPLPRQTAQSCLITSRKATSIGELVSVLECSEQTMLGPFERHSLPLGSHEPKHINLAITFDGGIMECFARQVDCRFELLSV
jgi:hypothetical protein